MSSPAATTPEISAIRKNTLLLFFCVSQFLDSFNVSALISAIPIMTAQLGLNESESVWVISAYQLTFAAFLLVSGRIADVYSAKYTFIIGGLMLGLFSLVAGFVHNKIGILVLRALCGVGAALTIPSALRLIVRLFPDPKGQGMAFGVYGGSGALGNVLGLIFGALFVQFVNWSWVFWLVALLATPIAVVCIWLIPRQPAGDKSQRKFSNLDPLGIFMLTSSLILVIFALTEAGSGGWGRAMVIAPLVIGILLGAAFFVWETIVDPAKASFPPSMWFYPNFAIIFAIALSVTLWFTSVFIVKVGLWQDIYKWSPINSAVHFLPIGIICGPVMLFCGPFIARYEKKYVLLFSQVFLIVSTTILPFASTPEAYWNRDFPAFFIGTIGAGLLFVGANIAIFQSTPPELAGTVGAIFNSALQLGSAVGLAIMAAIQSSIDAKGGPDPYAGRADAFWFLLAVVAVETLAVLFLYRTAPKTKAADPELADDEKKEVQSEDATVNNSGRSSTDPKAIAALEKAVSLAVGEEL